MTLSLLLLSLISCTLPGALNVATDKLQVQNLQILP